MPYIVADLDNCIANDFWRRGAIRLDEVDPLKRYEAYHSLMLYDRFHNKHILNPAHGIVINTGRPERYRDVTRAWLLRHGVDYRYLLMRPDEDGYVPTVTVKEMNIVELLQLTNETVVIAYDDRQDVIEMYRRLGFPAERLAIIEQTDVDE